MTTLYQIVSRKNGDTVGIEQCTGPSTGLTKFQDTVSTNGIEEFHLTGVGVHHADRPIGKESNTVGLEKFVDSSTIATEFVLI